MVSIARDKIKDYWEKSIPMNFTAEKWSYEQKRKFRYELQDYMHEVFKFGDFRGKRVLDFGCGAGIDSLEFARNGAIVTATDIAESACKLTMQHREEAGLTANDLKVDFLDSDILPYISYCFDCIYSFGVLHHIPEVEPILEELCRVLKPKGTIMAMLYNQNSLLFAYSILYLKGIKGKKWLDSFSLATIGRLTSDYSERNEGCPYTRTYAKGEAEELFSRYFSNVKISVHYNVIDLPGERKVKLDIGNKYELGWHLIVKGAK